MKKLTRIVGAEILSLARVLFALGPQVRLDRTFLTRLQNHAEDLFACPQSHGLMDTQHNTISAASRPQTRYVTTSQQQCTFIIAGRGRETLTFSSLPTRMDATIWQAFDLSKKVSFSVNR